MSRIQTVSEGAIPQDFEESVARYVRELIREQQQNIPEEPLRLAFFFSAEGQHSTIDLFEVIENFGGNRIAEMPELFQVTQEVSVEPDSPPVSMIRMILTNPVEVPVAFGARWVGTGPVKEAVRSGRYTVVYGDPHDSLLDVIRGQ
jgi:hypothetical protein